MWNRHALFKTASASLLGLSLVLASNSSISMAQKTAPTPKPRLSNNGVSPSGAQPLPALPSSSAIAAVAGKGAPFYSMGIPANILNDFAAFDAAGLSIKNALDPTQAVSYINLSGSLLQMAIPLKGAATSVLQPNMTTPDDGSSGYIVGGLYQATNGASVIVATFNGSGKKVKDLRFYTVSSGRLSYNDLKYKGRKLSGAGGQPSPGDAGAVLSNAEDCFTVGLDQVCFPPDNGTRDSGVNSIIQQSYNTLSNAYNLGVSFDLNDAVPDLIGQNYRAQCAAAGLSGSACIPDLVVTSALSSGGTQPIAIFHVMRANDLPAYDVNGNFVGGLPVGDYVVLNAQPGQGANTPGANGALFLVNAYSGQPNYLIPAQAVEGFGTADDGDNGNQAQAAVKDGMCGGWGW